MWYSKLLSYFPITYFFLLSNKLLQHSQAMADGGGGTTNHGIYVVASYRLLLPYISIIRDNIINILGWFSSPPLFLAPLTLIHLVGTEKQFNPKQDFYSACMGVERRNKTICLEKFSTLQMGLDSLLIEMNNKVWEVYCAYFSFCFVMIITFCYLSGFFSSIFHNFRLACWIDFFRWLLDEYIMYHLPTIVLYYVRFSW